MSTDNDHLSLPHLYGAPAHTPRRLAVVPTLPALGPDDLPIENYRSPEDHALALEIIPRSYAGHGIDAVPRPPQPSAGEPLLLRGKPLILRALAGRLLRTRGD